VNPESYTREIVNWQFFGTLTYKKERMPERVRMTMLFSWLRKAAENFRVHFPKLVWVVRQERGETFGRLHHHVLITASKAVVAVVVIVVASAAAASRLPGVNKASIASASRPNFLRDFTELPFVYCCPPARVQCHCQLAITGTVADGATPVGGTTAEDRSGA